MAHHARLKVGYEENRLETQDGKRPLNSAMKNIGEALDDTGLLHGMLANRDNTAAQFGRIGDDAGTGLMPQPVSG